MKTERTRLIIIIIIFIMTNYGQHASAGVKSCKTEAAKFYSISPPTHIPLLVIISYRYYYIIFQLTQISENKHDIYVWDAYNIYKRLSHYSYTNHALGIICMRSWSVSLLLILLLILSSMSRGVSAILYYILYYYYISATIGLFIHLYIIIRGFVGREKKTVRTQQ